MGCCLESVDTLPPAALVIGLEKLLTLLGIAAHCLRCLEKFLTLTAYAAWNPCLEKSIRCSLAAALTAAAELVACRRTHCLLLRSLFAARSLLAVSRLFACLLIARHQARRRSPLGLLLA